MNNDSGNQTNKANRKTSETENAKSVIWLSVPNLIWNISELKPQYGTRSQLVWIKLKHFAKSHVSDKVYLGYLILSVLTAILLGFICTKLGWIGYCCILAISFLSIYLGQDSKIKEELWLREEIQSKLIRICEIYNIHSQYSGDIRKGILGASMGPLVAALVLFPYRITLFTAYGIIVFMEQLHNLGCPLDWFGQWLGNLSGVKYIAVAFLAIDRAVILLKDEKDRIAQKRGGQKKQVSSVYEPVFLKSHFYVLDSYIAKLTTGNTLIAEIDKQSLAYQLGIRQFDIITSINGLNSDVATLQSELKKWREGVDPLVVEIVTDKSDYQESKKVHLDIGVTLNTYTHLQFDDALEEMKKVCNK